MTENEKQIQSVLMIFAHQLDLFVSDTVELLQDQDLDIIESLELVSGLIDQRSFQIKEGIDNYSKFLDTTLEEPKYDS